ncbi:hypothetical protein CHS0354_040323 [Potamilus streckersoni]|uniref:Uncharacterized protein n=1 Tax=Potamilus streckersoni TaxID=2493646 RepID=A0AAE0VVA3_9BIVA|nr:hypothetical protein CHS0354_040323 [Potamilus streckersoni]
MSSMSGQCVKQDLMFILDSSNTLGVENFMHQKDFVKDMIRQYQISPVCTRVGVVTYSSGVYNQFFLDGYNTQMELLGAIDNIQYQPGLSHAADAIKFVTSSSFLSQHGDRSDAPNVAVLVSGSDSGANTATVSAANDARRNGITFYSVGVGSSFNQGEMMGVANDPDSRYYMQSESYDSLGSLAQPLALRLANGAMGGTGGMQSMGTPNSCMQQADLVFLVDSSGSIGQTNFLKMESFLKQIVNNLDVGPNKVHVGLMQFSNYPSLEFPLDMYSSRQDVMAGIDKMQYMGGGTNTADAIKYMRSQLFSQNSGARSNVPRIAIVITDGRSANPTATQTEADNARVDNIGIVSIGVGPGVDVNELHNIADQPANQNSFTVSNYDQLQTIVGQLIQRACMVRSTAPPRTNQQGGTPAPDPCSDKILNCRNYDMSVCSGTYAPWARDNCPSYCGFCQPLYTTAPPPCEDKLDNCASFSMDVCMQADYKRWAEDNCRRFCGFCGPQTSSVGFYGKCFYKGKSYQHGEKWDDGCDYSCVCEDGKSGRYRCYNRCPVYYNLPSGCTLVHNPNECCQQPVCNFNQQLQSFQSSGPGTTPDGISVCVYKGNNYYQDQTWNDGCDFTCSCADSNSGLYKCHSRCPQYTTIPSYCHMEKKPGDCCNKPVCEFNTQQGSFTGMGSISGKGVGETPTAPPPCVDNLADCSRYEDGMCQKYQPWARDNCRKYCNLCDETAPTPGPSDRCIYQGNIFSQGQTWKVGCDTVCTCENAAYGYYRCVNTCPQYNNLPTGCYETKKSGECCATVKCDQGTFLSSTNNLMSIGNGGLIFTGASPFQPTIPSGGTPPPGAGGTNNQAPRINGCLYKGQMYLQDQIWTDGCDYSCECTDANTGMYNCKPKCPVFPNLPAECHLEADPNQPCCKIPKCSFSGAPIPVYPVYHPSMTGHSEVRPPSPSDLYNGTQNIIDYVITVPASTPAPPTAGTGGIGGIGYCEYKGQRYNQGQRWEDGCDYNCVCDDASIGHYRCIDKCLKYENLPVPFCRLVPDPKNACCKIPECKFTGESTSMVFSAAITTPKPVPQTTPAPQFVTNPKPQMCVYKDQQYGQGQVWYDGCTYRCSCDNAMMGFYRCVKRCPEYFGIPDSCTTIPDPQDPGCCTVPVCPQPTPGANGQTVIPTIPPGSFVGQSNNTNVGYCEYKNQRYRQNDRWTDGCDFQCVCEDETKGLYKCDDMCPRYPALPPQCRLITDFTNPCCKKPDCQFGSSFGEISGTLTPPPPSGFPAPSMGPTQAPHLSYCIYQNARYVQGQEWNDGCTKKCRCDDADRGLYVCDDRCPQYNNIPPQCQMVTDPRDPCCRQPQCNFTPVPVPGSIEGTTLAPTMIPTKVPGVIHGQVNTPAPTPGPDGRYPSPVPLNYCEYKGGRYSQGQTWDDGCDFTCTCQDAMNGKYECTEKCPQYTNIPPQCHLVKDAGNPCCFKPLCDFNPNPGGFTFRPTTKAPLPGQTNAPTPMPPTFAPNLNPNLNPYPSPGLPKSVCVYRGQSYTQGQQWFDDCDYKCTCEEAEKGIYRCSRRCATYDPSSLPAQCKLVQDPQDPFCCKVPQCSMIPTNNTSNNFPTPPPGKISGGSVNPTPLPNYGPTPAPQPGVSTLAPNLKPTPQPRAVCVYKGQEYTQGQRWQDGCDYNCECVEAMTGRYECTEMCPRYVNLPSYCQLNQDPMQPCCKKPSCNFQGTPGVQTGQLSTPAPLPGQTHAPGMGPTPMPNGPTLAPTPKKLCIYNGAQYSKGQRWDDGCDLHCVCEDDMTGYYRCNQRCPTYNNLAAQCTLVTDPNDPCCRVPLCIAPTPGPNIIPTPGPGHSTIAPFPGSNPSPLPGHSTQAPQPTPSPIPTAVPGIIDGQGITPVPSIKPPPGASTPAPVCVYDGVAYGQGQTWRDGCRYDCECVSAQTGQYRCRERCSVYPSVPANCRLVSDPNDPCCKVPECATPAPTPKPPTYPLNPTPGPLNTPTPGPGQTFPTPVPGQPHSPIPGMPTPAPPTSMPQPKEVCRMNGREYTTGQQWDDGCDRRCVCEDGKTGYYRCTDRCKVYASIPRECTLVPDPNDPICCKVPQCIPGLNGNPTPTPGTTNQPQYYTNVPHATVTGSGTPPPPTINPYASPTPGSGPSGAPTPAPRQVCVYNGNSYIQGQRWRDGCDYNCECVDSMTGKYVCTERCSSYPQVPPQCTMVRDPNDFCCYVAQCDWNKPIPTPGVNPTPSPGSYITPRPGPGVSPGATFAPPHQSTLSPPLQPGVSPTPGNPYAPSTPSPNVAFCVYNGVPFRQGDTIDDGCNQRCRCDDASMNYYNCFDRCPTFNNINAGCFMVTDPNDPCCQVPQCTYVPTPQPTPQPTPSRPHSPLPPGVSTIAPPSQVPTVAPSATPPPMPVPTAVPGVILSKPDPTRPPSQRGFCVYNGVKYTQGQKWDDGCNLICECLDDNTGQYKCTERCPKYVNIPSYCVMVEDPNDRCCKTPYCPNLVPTPNPNIAPTPGPNPSPGQPGYHPPTHPSGVTMVPGMSTVRPTLSPPLPGYNSPTPGSPVNPTPIQVPTPQPAPVSRDVCIMSGRSYTTGQKWTDGCKQNCVCDDGRTGLYTCNERCPTYNNIAPTCIFEPDPKDPICCQIPKCDRTNSTIPTPIKGTITGSNNPTPTPAPGVSPNPNPNPNPYNVPTPGPGLTYPPGMVPTPGFTPAPNPMNPLSPTPGPNPGTNPFPTPQPQPKVCVYKGQPYTQGQRWRDGCDYDCECYDAENGKYRCTDICSRYPQLPPTCVMVYDPLNPCCKKPDCSNPTPASNINPTPFPGFNPSPQPGQTFAPTPGTNPNPNPNPQPKMDFCVYNGIPLRQGQTFNDGCDKICRCEDSMSNKIVCDERCRTYPPLPSSCYLVTDPNDQCCQIPQCVPTHPNNNPNITTVPNIPGVITGSNMPNPLNPPSISGKRDVCMYHGQMYKTGDKWEDGCTYQCECVDGMTGNYRCTERCPQHPYLPPSCTMVSDPNDACCTKPYCPSLIPTPGPNPQQNPYASPTPGPHGFPTVAPRPGVSTHAPHFGSTLQPPVNPGMIPTPGPNVNTPAPKPRDVCEFNGQYYRQDQVWYDGCNAICKCEDAAMNYHRCQERCARFDIPPQCTSVPDPKDPTCCRVPDCPLMPTAGPVPTPGYLPNPSTPKPGVITGLAPVPTSSPPYLNPQPGVSTPYPNPNPQPGVSPTPGPHQSTPKPVPKTGCFYKGMVYHNGQKWDDGCQYECECIDDMTGQYRCLERCTQYPNLPQQCILMPDPNDRCCQKPYCDFVNPTPFPTGYPTPSPNMYPSPLPGQPTPSPGPQINPSPTPAGYCVYNGAFYKQGQSWNDGCNKQCRCEDVQNNYYTCTDRCRSYSNLPANCVLRTDPHDSCCLVPDCNSFMVNPAPGTGPSGTGQQPGVTYPPGFTGQMPTSTHQPLYVVPTYIPGTITGTAPQPDGGLSPMTGSRSVCVYKGQMYNTGDKWDDGCTYKCDCVDGTRGQYRCTERCPNYYYMPPKGCIYEEDPNDRCCKRAKCDIYAIPTPGPSPVIINPGQNTGPTGIYNPPGVSTLYPIIINPGQNTGPTGIYNPPGVSTLYPIIINPGQNTGPTGIYYPPGVSTQYPVIINPGQQTGPTGSGPNIPGGTNNPITGTREFCVYKDNSVHRRGESWKDGCDMTCTCDDPVINDYKCTHRCQIYSDIPSYCYLVQDPADNCCMKPVCSSPNGPISPIIPGSGPTVSPTLPPGTSNVVPIGTHVVFSGSGTPSMIPGPTGMRSACVYKGSVYEQGKSWDDGCDFTCTCTNSDKGMYQCTSKCPKLPPLPSYCKLINVPGQCCPSMDCSIPNYGKYNPSPQLIPTPMPTPGPGQTLTTSNPLQIYPVGQQTVSGGTSFPGGGYPIPPGTVVGNIRNQCVYKNKLYNQGEKWEDGCDYQCDCIEAKSGYYECKPLCPQYNNLPQECYLVRAAGQCCATPICRNPDGTQINPITNPSSLYPVYGSYSGGYTGFKPGYTPNPNSVGGFSNRCMYKGKIYGQGEAWEDGCDYTCQCTDAQHGLYQCHAKCPSYTQLPPVCRMADIPGQCCQEVQCNQQPLLSPTTARTASPLLGNCADLLDNCDAYGHYACEGQYKTWAEKNCRAYCGFCTMAVTTPPPACADKLSNCALYGQTACTGIYEPWARDNCRKFCNLCHTTVAPGPTSPVAPNPQCQDQISNCAQYTTAACNPPYEEWAVQNCPRFCNKCHLIGPVPSGPTGTVTPNNWIIMMKGVAGAPGDLYQLWSGPGTSNTNVPEAMYLTSTYNGHYKPDLSNHWNDLCIDKVKVAIFNNGLEKANIIFDARGADKNSWFSPDRVISSTWADIKNAPKNLFSMLGDPSTGHEFAVSSSGTGCNSNGWMMISTTGTCPFESGTAKPAFYFAPGQSMTNFGMTQPGSGDVFAILAHSDCNSMNVHATPPAAFTSRSNYCIYKSQIYSQGQTWTDGCEYNCTCEDGSTGFYRCNALCPIYTNLPPGCNLLKKPGECCAVPDCLGPSGTYQAGRCLYKGQMYNEGQKWQDGCDYMCTCVNGTTGFYQCNSLCLTWNLPDVCHLDPPVSGKCCKTPVCPSYVQIQYPQGYQEL